jgi:hypothetical protein
MAHEIVFYKSSFLFSARKATKTQRFLCNFGYNFVKLCVTKNTKFAIKKMRTDSNAFIYAVSTIVIAHFVIGFIWLWRKMNKKK